MKILWFSRHEMTDSQKNDLDQIFKAKVEVNQVNKTIKHAGELKEEIEACDVACVVMPLNLQQQMLKTLGNKPMLISKNHRIQKEDGSFEFVHGGWEKIKKIEIVKEVLSDYPAPESSFRGKD